MFEKEAEENGFGIGCTVNPTIAFQKGAEFGYNKAFVEADKNLKAVVTDFNKANEWHYVKDGYLPKHENYVLVSNGKDWTKGFYENGKWNVISLVGFLHIIAWKEIELPEGVNDNVNSKM